MSTLATADTIGIHLEAHLVALWVCVEWRAVVNIAELFAIGVLHYCELSQGLGDSEGVLPGWGLEEERSRVECHCFHSQSQAVILEVLGVGVPIIRQGRMGDELRAAPASTDLISSHTSTASTVCM